MKVIATLYASDTARKEWEATIVDDSDPVLVDVVGAVIGQNVGCELSHLALHPDDVVSFRLVDE